jgi:hypothetical protein
LCDSQSLAPSSFARAARLEGGRYVTWLPIGPDFVFAPRSSSFKRLSLRNEGGRQGLVSSIAIDPTEPETIYVVERPSSGGASAFRTRDDGMSWTPIADALQQVNPGIDPTCVAINPDHPEIVYLGTWGDGAVYVSTNRGEPGSWGPRRAVGGNVRKLIVDPRTSAVTATTVLYAAASTGVHRSADGGQTWAQVLAGDVWTLEAHIPPTGAVHFYAGVANQGAFYSTNPTGTWTNLNTAGIGLPARVVPDPVNDPAGNWNVVLVDFCRRNPARAYAWFLKEGVTQFLYTTAAPATSWTQIPMTGPPSPWYGWYAMAFAVAPNSPGDGVADVLFFGSGGVDRSIDAGRTWTGDAVGFHVDQHAMAFWPASPPGGLIPAMYSGNDGGIAKSTRMADPAYVTATAPPHHNEADALADSGAWTNRNHGKQSSAVYQYGSPPSAPALSYIGCQDTAVAGGESLVWRSLGDADGGAIAAAAGPNGVSVWGILGIYAGWPGFRIIHWIDRGDFAPSTAFVSLRGSLLAGTSNYVTGLDGNGLAGAVMRDTATTLAAAITAGPAAQAATPASMTGIAVGTRLAIGVGTANEEVVQVTATTATTFSAVFARNHGAGDVLNPERSFVHRLRHDSSVLEISQDLAADGHVWIVAASPSDPNILYCGMSEQRVYATNAGATAGPGTVWTPVATNQPAGMVWFGTALSDIDITPGNEPFVLLNNQTTVGGVTSPLFSLAGGTWTIQACTNVPATPFNFGKLVADPVLADVLYASHGARVYRVTRSEGTWDWEDISAGLPGQWIYDLTARTVSYGGNTKVLLRAAIPTRAIFETEVTAEAKEPAVALYVRDNLIDLGLLNPSPEGVPNPYAPSETLWHYMCADVKIDARQNSTIAGNPPFFQTDPESAIPSLDHVRFGQLRDHSQNLPQNDQAWVHVQVQNRSLTPANAVRVWAVYCNASAGVPALSRSAANGDAFPFWSQFTSAGTIIPGLPGDSPWTSLGPPRMLNGIDAAHPQVASWPWTLPTLPNGDPGHFCIAVFVHSAAAPIGETTRMDVDVIAPRNPQVGQKNLHIGAPLAPGGRPGGGGGGGPGGRPYMREYVEFHNATAQERLVDLVLDLRALPPQLGVSFQLTPLTTARPLEQSLEGVASVRQIGPRESVFPPTRRGLIARLLAWLRLLVCRLLNILRRLTGRPPRPCGRPRVRLPDFERRLLVAVPSARVAVRDVLLPAFGEAAVAIAVELGGTLTAGARYGFDVQQLAGGQVIGGGRYIVVMQGDPPDGDELEKLRPPTHDPTTPREEAERLEREAERLRFVPPFARRIVEDREREQGKR